MNTSDLIASLASYVSADDVGLPRTEFLRMVADRINSDVGDRKPVRVIVDFSGGLFNGVMASEPVEVMAIDEDDPEHPRAVVPGYGDAPIWAGIESTIHGTTEFTDPAFVNAAFDGIAWLPDDENTES